MNFEDLVKSRHSAMNFIETEQMTEEDFKNIFELTKMAPSAYNLQFTNYLVITDQEKKERVKELSYNQYKIHTASGVVIVMGNKNSIEMPEVERIYSPLKMLKMMDEVEYDMTMELIKGYSDGLKNNPHELNLELVRNAGIHAMLFMLSAKHYGFDTCPMHVHNVDELRKEFNIPDHLEPIMMITIGKSVDKVRARGYRKPVGEFVNFNGY
ncbi:putative NAD(P)H nitroreductase [Solibacillus kalamii]|uniref:Nitroreductase n=2 Tax=Solibacillus TaxID=648800 RepID=F2F892_SOLSS|nr:MULTISPECIES: nitroreductase family protein [Solibacillus]MBM7664689.1 putative NAD(P)H nitroreductase [Solibacillus kalamii]OUZ40933.1 nitroreductase family protein [Solibacillus kalamii]BAK17896.1 nitroreductase [Solibacillus silvestris StLB046]